MQDKSHYTRYNYKKLYELAVEMFIRYGFSREDSEKVADVILTSDRFGDAQLVAAKTGYTPEARFCLVSYAETASGGRYVLVSVGGTDRYAPVYDCKYAYGEFAK